MFNSHQTLNYHFFTKGVHSNALIIKNKKMELDIVESRDSKQKEWLLNLKVIVNSDPVKI